MRLTGLVRGGPFNQWGCLVYWRGILIHTLRSFLFSDALTAKAGLRINAEQFVASHCRNFRETQGQELTPERLRAWALDFGSLKSGEQVY